MSISKSVCNLDKPSVSKSIFEDENTSSVPLGKPISESNFGPSNPVSFSSVC